MSDCDYHVYELREAPPLTWAPWRQWAHRPIASCDGDALAFTLDTLHAEGQLTNESRVGILLRPADQETGVWLVNPYAEGRR